ncbi:MAG: BatD family protein [Phycisphaerales bacterium]
MTTRAACILLAVLFTLLGLAPAASAQDDAAPDITVSAEADRRRVYVGDRVRYLITVSGSNAPEVPELELPDGVVGQFRGGRERSSSFTSIINGRRVTRSSLAYIFEYVVSPQREGQFEFGPATVVVEGEPYETNRVTLTAVQPEDVSADYPITAELDRTELWVGEAVRVRVTWAFQPDVENPSFDVTSIPDAMRVLENRARPDWAGVQETRMGTVLGQDLSMGFGRTSLDGRVVRTLSFELLVTPVEAGTYDLGPVGVVFDRVVRGRGRVRVISTSDPIPVRVRELPTEGQPPGFNGLVGRYGVRASVSTLSANVGDPIELEVRIEGDEPMVGVTDGPDLSVIEGFTDAFQLAADGWELVPSEIPGRRVFRTTIRPTSESVTELPAIELPYFDVEEGVYRVARAEPIPLEVRAVRETTAADALRTGVPAARARLPLDSAGDAFWAHERGPGLLTTDGFDPIARATEPAWLGAILAPPVGWLCVVGWGAVSRSRDPVAARRRAALRKARRAARSDGVAAGARRLVADLLGRDLTAVTAADCDALSLTDETRAQLVELIGSEEATRFGGLPPSMPDSARAKRTLAAAFRQEMGGAR